MAGRPTKYTRACLERIVRALELGATHRLAAAAGGINENTFCEWEHDKPAFRDAVKSAEARAAERWLHVIEVAAEQGTWQAAAWKLERRYRHEYGTTVQEQQGSTEIRVTYTNNWRRQGGTDGDGA